MSESQAFKRERLGVRLMTVFAFTENVMIREKDSLMSSEMNVSLLLSYFVGNKMVGGAV